jgi:transcriptional antiterminator NusG
MLMAQAGWYAIQSYSGHENKVQRLIQQKIDLESGETPEEKEIQQVLVPTQEATELRNGKRVQVIRRLYPGYVLVRMVYNERTQHLINGIQGVIKFVSAGTRDPRPLRDDEMNKILGIASDEAADAVRDVPFRVGEVVEIIQGPFTDFSGTVQEVISDKGKVKVEVSLFGRPTSVELDFTQVKGF